jgi:glycine/D-amino acid oxidase-like deaminating enzyme
MNELVAGYGEAANDLIRVHETANSSYQAPISKDWKTAPTGVDVLQNQELIRKTFPSYDTDVKTLIHIRRAGDISGQQMGQHMLDYFKNVGGVRVTAEVVSIDKTDGFQVTLGGSEDRLYAEHIVNAAGPFINDIAEMLGTKLPVRNTVQQKIAFEDVESAIPRSMPFSIDLDDQLIDWNDEERDLLATDEDYAWLTENMQGAIHCRPDGGDNGRWVKLGWAYNDTSETSLSCTPLLYENFPEIVLRGAARLNPALKAYYDRLPSKMHHYGGYHTLTDENWPLIGTMDVEGTYVVGAMSGFGTMAACASGDLCARTVLGRELPEFAEVLSLQRYNDLPLMESLMSMSSRGIL